MRDLGLCGALLAVGLLAACGDDTSATGTGSGGSGSGSGGDAATSTTTSGTTSSSTGATAATTATSSSTGGDGGAGGGDTGSGGDATGAGGSGAGTITYECGTDPDVTFTGTFIDFSNQEPIEGVVVTADICEDLAAESDENGVVVVALPSNTAYNPKAVASGFIPLRTGEQLLEANLEGFAPMVPSLFEALLPGWGDDVPTLFVVTEAAVGVPEDPCTLADGIVVGVVGNLDAVVTYYSDQGQAPTPDPDLTATSSNGFAAISGLEDTAGQATIQLTATKEGCDTLSFVSYPYTGNHVLENGVLTAAALFMVPVDGP